jgi:hypothetical protein
MMKRLASLRLIAWFVILASPALAHAQALADRVPADTILYVGWRGSDTPGSGYEGSHLQAVLAESNFPKVFDEMLPKVLDRIAKEDRHAAEAVEVFRTFAGPMWRHPTAIAFVGIAVDPNKGPEPTPKLVMLCQAGAESAAIKMKVEQILQKAGKPPFPVHVVDRDGLVALVIGYDNPADAIPDAGAGASSLANSPRFSKTLQQVNRNGLITAYVDVEKVVNLVEFGLQAAPPEIKKGYAAVSDKLGLKGIKRAIMSAGFDGKDWSARLFVAAPEPRTGLLGTMLEGKPLSEHLLGSIPENSTIAGAFHFDIAGLVDVVRAAIASFDADAGRQADQAIEQVNQTTGIDIQKDLLHALGDEWAYYNDPSVAGNGIVGITMLNHLKEPAKVEASLTKLEDFINVTAAQQLKHEKVTVSFKRSHVGDTTVHYLAIPLVTPSWAVHNGNLYVGLYPEMVVAAIAHVPGQGKSILTNPAFAAVMHKLGDHPASSFGFADLQRLAPENYSTWLAMSHLANAGDLFGIPAPILMPPLDKLLAHLSGAGQVSWTDGDGLHIAATMPFPGSQVFAADPTNLIFSEMLGMGMMFQYRTVRPQDRARAEIQEDRAREIQRAAPTTRPFRN